MAKSTKPISTKQIYRKDMSDIDKIKYGKLYEDVVKASLHSGKVMGIYLGFTAKGEPEVVYWGASPQITTRAHYLATKFADMLPGLMMEYEIPHVDIQEQGAKS